MDYPFTRTALPAGGIFVTDEQIRLFARKRGFEALATWAAECMSLSPREAAVYEQGIVSALLANSGDGRVLCRVQTDLERAGKPALSTYAGTVFANAVAEATSDFKQHSPETSPSHAPRPRSSERGAGIDRRA